MLGGEPGDVVVRGACEPRARWGQAVRRVGRGFEFCLEPADPDAQVVDLLGDPVDLAVEVVEPGPELDDLADAVVGDTDRAPVDRADRNRVDRCVPRLRRERPRWTAAATR